MTKQFIKKSIEDADDVVRAEDIASGKMILCTRRKDGSIVRDKNGKVVPKSFLQHERIERQVETKYLQEEASIKFSSYSK